MEVVVWKCCKSWVLVVYAVLMFLVAENVERRDEATTSRSKYVYRKSAYSFPRSCLPWMAKRRIGRIRVMEWIVSTEQRKLWNRTNNTQGRVTAAQQGLFDYPSRQLLPPLGSLRMQPFPTCRGCRCDNS